MNACHHVGWFHISGRTSFQLHYSNRTGYVTQEMLNAEGQYPSLLFFIGSKSKDAALRELFPNNNIRRGHRNGIVNLRLDSSTISSDLPLLFADGDLRTPIPDQLGTTTCHEQLTFPVDWQPQNFDIAHILYARLIAPFTDVVCIFADDFGGLEKVATFLVNWLKLGSPSSLSVAVRPRVLIVVREESPTTYNVLEMEVFRHILDGEGIDIRREVFSSITVIHLAGEHISPLARHRRLKEVLMMEVETARDTRFQQRLLFSALHFEAFFRQAVGHVAHSINETFDFVTSARMHNNIRGDYTSHLTNFITLSNEYFVAYQSLTSFLASSILMDAYPPNMHSESV